VILYLQHAGGEIAVAFREGRRGARVPAGGPPKLWRTLYVEGFSEPVRIPPTLGDALASAVGSAVVPVFVAPPDPAPRRAWERLASAVVADASPRAAEVIRLAQAEWRHPDAVALPLRIVVVDDAAPLETVRIANWVSNPVVQRFGLRIENVSSGALASAVESPGSSILAVSPPALDVALAAAARAGDRAQARLVLLLEDVEAVPPWTSLPPGVALLRVAAPPGLRARFVDEFVLGLVHDQPLHAATFHARQVVRGAGGPLEALLTADPGTNDALRLSVAALGLERAARKLRRRLERRVPEELRSTLEGALRLEATELRDRFGDDASRLVDAAYLLASIDAHIEDAERTGREYEHETGGLVPQAKAEAGLERATDALAELVRLARPLRAETARSDALEEAAVRVVTVDEGSIAAPERARIEPPAPRLRAVDMALTGASGEVADRSTVLATSREYLLRFRIGQPYSGSLFEAAPPAITPLLPPLETPEERREGHRLEVACFGLDFKVRRNVIEVRLPPVGPSGEAEFRVIAPDREGPARLRVCVYHRGHLVQSFLVNAIVGAIGERRDGALRASVEFSRTEGFGGADMDALGPRALSLGVNQGPAGTHSLVVKGEGVAADVHFPEQVMADVLREFRAILERATTVDGGRTPVFPVEPAGAVAGPFDDVIRDLARLGAHLYAAGVLGPADDAVRRTLWLLAQEEDRTIQIVRYDPRNAFPWTGLYVFTLPLDVAGAPPARVCRGTRPDGSHCGHTPTSVDCYCIRGFWGTRYVVEQLIRPGRPGAATLGPACRDPAICVATDEGDRPSRELLERLRGEVGAAVAASAPGDLMDALWVPDRRPVALIVLGHLETKDVAGEPRGPRIRVGPGVFLTIRDVEANLVSRLGWQGVPRSAVFVMGCATAGIDVSTLNDFSVALWQAGATAVVGTECIAFSDLLAHFAREVTAALWSGRRLGAAVREARIALLRAGNPLGFIFTAFGDADLVLAKERS
jgi:hypothetical protein